jgi:hypothetical protein
VNPAGGDFHLQSNSPCINSGNNAYVSMTNDLDGNPRLAGGTVDVGAYEFQSPVSRISYLWLQQYNLPIDTNTDVSDPDGDGMNNWQEWIAGTSPVDPASYLYISSLAVLASSATIGWASVTTRHYSLEFSTNLGASPPRTKVATNIPGLSGETFFTQTNVTGRGPFFYRILVE